MEAHRLRGKISLLLDNGFQFFSWATMISNSKLNKCTIVIFISNSKLNNNHEYEIIVMDLLGRNIFQMKLIILMGHQQRSRQNKIRHDSSLIPAGLSESQTLMSSSYKILRYFEMVNCWLQSN